MAILKQGTLRKWTRSLGGQWIDRHFVLEDNGRLSYYPTRKDVNQIGGCIGSVSIAAKSSVIRESLGCKTELIVIYFNIIWYLRAKDPREKGLWLEAFLKCKQANEKLDISKSDHPRQLSSYQFLQKIVSSEKDFNLNLNLWLEKSFYQHEIHRLLLEKSAKEIFLDKYVPQILKCPICYEVFQGQVLQCRIGHSVCSKCFGQMTQCPICREPYFYGMEVRNRLIEDLVEEMDMACLGQRYGCGFRGNLKEMGDHVGKCSWFVVAEKLGEQLKFQGEGGILDGGGGQQGTGEEGGEIGGGGGGGLLVLGSRKREGNGGLWWWWVKNGINFLIVVLIGILFCWNINWVAKGLKVVT